MITIKRTEFSLLGVLVLLASISKVVAHTEEAGPTFGLVEYLLVIAFVSLVVAFSLVMLRKFETIPGTLPIRKLAIVAAITIIINSLLLGYIYRDVLL